MTNVNPNLRTFSDMYKSGYQPLFMPIQQQPSPAPMNQSSPQLQPQPQADTVTKSGKKKMGKGKKLAIAGVAIAATAAAAFAAVSFLGNGKMPREVKDIQTAVSGLKATADAALSGAKNLQKENAALITSEKERILPKAEAVKTEAATVLDSAKQKVQEVVELFTNKGKDKEGNQVAQFFLTDGSPIAEADLTAALANKVRMVYGAADARVESLFDGGNLAKITQFASDTPVERIFVESGNPTYITKGIATVEGSSLYDKVYDFRRGFDALEYIDKAVVTGTSYVERGEVYIYDGGALSTYIQDASTSKGATALRVNFLNDEITRYQQNVRTGGVADKAIELTDGKITSIFERQESGNANILEAADGKIRKYAEEYVSDEQTGTILELGDEEKLVRYAEGLTTSTADDGKVTRTIDKQIQFADDGNAYISDFKSVTAPGEAPVEEFGVSAATTPDMKVDYVGLNVKDGAAERTFSLEDGNWKVGPAGS